MTDERSSQRTITDIDGRAALGRRSAIGRMFMLPAGLSTFGLLGVQWTSRTAPASTTGRASASTPSLFRGYVAGFQFHEGPALLERMRTGDPVTLVREPENPHDRHAVRIDYGGRKVGYVPRMVSEHVSWAIADRATAPGTISAVSPGAVPWRALQVRAG